MHSEGSGDTLEFSEVDRSSPLCIAQNLRPFSTLDLTSPMLGVAPEHTRQLLLEGPVRVKEGREGKVRELWGGAEKMGDELQRKNREMMETG